MLLLWNNFLTTILLSFSCLFFFKIYGTTSFSELQLITNTSKIVYLYLIAVGWKLGLPLFHFFKLEVYQYLLRENVFLFSIITVVINLFILFFLLKIEIVYFSLYSNNFIVLILLVLVNILILNLKLQSMLLFFAVSGLVTTTTLLTVFII